MTPSRLRELIAMHGFDAAYDAVAREARREAYEAAAALATERTKKYTDFSTSWHVAADCAAAIRALKETP